MRMRRGTRAARAVFALPDGTPCAHAGELHPKVCETLGLPARSVAFEILLDPIIAFTPRARWWRPRP